MAISAGAAGAWAAVNATTQTVTLPTHSAGQMLLAVVAAKAAIIGNVDITTSTTGWSRLAQFKDGTTNSGNGTGSVCQSIFYKVAESGSETNPVFGFATTATPGIAVAQSFSKGGGEVWLTPVVVQAQTTNATSISVTMGSNPGITSGDWGVIYHTTRDDSALTVPSWSATGATLAAVVEYPATAIASGTSDDMAGDSAYRAVSSGTASAAPVVTGTQAAAETGVTGFVRLRVEAANPQTVTPTTASLTTTTFAPTVTIPNNQLVTPTTLAVTTSTFAPTIAHVINAAGPTALALTTFAPVVALAVTPTTTALTLTTFAPTVSLSDNQTVTPDTAALTTAAFAPTIAVSDHQVVTPTTLAASLATFAPTVAVSDHQLVTPDVAALATSTFEPTVSASDHKIVIPDLAALTITTFAPTVDAFQGTTVVPTTASLALATFAPDAVLTDNQLITPAAAALALTTFAPIVTALAPQTFTPATAALTLATLAPTVAITGPVTFIDGELALGPIMSGSVAASRVRARIAVNPIGFNADVEVD